MENETLNATRVSQCNFQTSKIRSWEKSIDIFIHNYDRTLRVCQFDFPDRIELCAIPTIEKAMNVVRDKFNGNNVRTNGLRDGID